MLIQILYKLLKAFLVIIPLRFVNIFSIPLKCLKEQSQSGHYNVGC